MYIYIGTSFNVATKATIISVPQKYPTGSVLFLVYAKDTATMSTNFLMGNKHSPKKRRQKNPSRAFFQVATSTRSWPFPRIGRSHVARKQPLKTNHAIPFTTTSEHLTTMHSLGCLSSREHIKEPSSSIWTSKKLH